MAYLNILKVSSNKILSKAKLTVFFVKIINITINFTLTFPNTFVKSLNMIDRHKTHNLVVTIIKCKN